MRRKVAWLKLRNLPPTDNLIALKRLPNVLCTIALMASRGLIFLYVEVLWALINDILKLRNWRKLTMSVIVFCNQNKILFLS